MQDYNFIIGKSNQVKLIHEESYLHFFIPPGSAQCWLAAQFIAVDFSRSSRKRRGKKGKGRKSERRMPRLPEAKKDVVSCEKSRGSANRK